MYTLLTLFKSDWKGGETKTVNGKEVTVFTHHSPHLDQGFPGSVDAKVTYTSYKQVDPADNIEKVYLELEYEAVLAEDSPVDETVISLTNHNFFNVSEAGVTNAGTQLKVFSNQTILHDQETLVPTGQIGAHPDIPADLDFFTLTKTEPEIDHAFFVEDSPEFKGLDTRKYRAVQPHVHIYNPESKINVVVGSTEPVFQVYTGKFMNIPLLPGESRTFEKNSCIACEPARPLMRQRPPSGRTGFFSRRVRSTVPRLCTPTGSLNKSPNKWQFFLFIALMTLIFFLCNEQFKTTMSKFLN